MDRDLITQLRNIKMMKEISNSQIEEVSRIKGSNIPRFFSERHSPTLKTFCAVAKALGLKIILEDEKETL